MFTPQRTQRYDLEPAQRSADPATCVQQKYSTIGDWLRATARAMFLAGAACGFGEATGVPASSRAEAGIVVSNSDEPKALALGETMSGLYRGPGSGGVLWVSATYDGVDGEQVLDYRGTAAAYSPRGAVATAHQFVELLNYPNLKIFVGTGPNYMTNPGTLHKVSVLSLHEGYTGTDSRAENPDIAVLRYELPVEQPQMTIAESRPPAYEPLLWGGYGRSGSVFEGYRAHDGAARAGISYVGTQGPLEGESPYLYVNTTMFLGLGTPELRPAGGDSGSPVFNWNGELVGIYARAGTSHLSTYGLYTDLTNPGTRAFIDRHLSAEPPQPATPEPSTLLLAAMGAAGVLAARMRKK
jgi:hypothetical protein